MLRRNLIKILGCIPFVSIPKLIEPYNYKSDLRVKVIYSHITFIFDDFVLSSLHTCADMKNSECIENDINKIAFDVINVKKYRSITIYVIGNTRNNTFGIYGFQCA